MSTLSLWFTKFIVDQVDHVQKVDDNDHDDCKGNDAQICVQEKANKMPAFKKTSNFYRNKTNLSLKIASQSLTPSVHQRNEKSFIIYFLIVWDSVFHA